MIATLLRTTRDECDPIEQAVRFGTLLMQTSETAVQEALLYWKGRKHENKKNGNQHDS